MHIKFLQRQPRGTHRRVTDLRMNKHLCNINFVVAKRPTTVPREIDAFSQQSYGILTRPPSVVAQLYAVSTERTRLKEYPSAYPHFAFIPLELVNKRITRAINQALSTETVKFGKCRAHGRHVAHALAEIQLGKYPGKEREREREGS